MIASLQSKQPADPDQTNELVAAFNKVLAENDEPADFSMNSRELESNENDIRETINFGSAVDNRFINSMATISDKIVMLLNATKLLDAEHFFIQY